MARFYAAGGLRYRAKAAPVTANPSDPMAMPVGDLPGWTQLYSEDFNTPVVAANGDTFLGKYPNMAAYNGFTDTSGKGTYDASNATLTAHNSLLDIFLHPGSGNTRYVAAVMPYGYTGQTYGRLTMRMHSDTCYSTTYNVTLATLTAAASSGATTVTVSTVTASVGAISVTTSIQIGTDILSVTAVNGLVLTLSGPLTAAAAVGAPVKVKAGYKGIPILLWPKSNQWIEGETDVFEDALQPGTAIHSNFHEVGAFPGSTATNSNNPPHPSSISGSSIDDHIWDLQWTPSYIQATVDGQVLKYSTNGLIIPTTPMVWRMQFEVNPASTRAPIPDPSVSGHVYIDWVTGYSYTP